MFPFSTVDAAKREDTPRWKCPRVGFIFSVRNMRYTVANRKHDSKMQRQAVLRFHPSPPSFLPLSLLVRRVTVRSISLAFSRDMFDNLDEKRDCMNFAIFLGVCSTLSECYVGIINTRYIPHVERHPYRMPRYA